MRNTAESTARTLPGGGRRGGVATLERYGRAWFVALGLRRHGRVTRSQLEESALELAGSLP
jgi:hypothetical protein